MAEVIKFQYTNWSNVENQEMTFKQVLTLIGDYQYNCPVDYLANTLAAKTNNIYKYLFDVRNPMNTWPKWSGVKHGDELDYLFGRPILSNNESFTDEHVEVSIFMIEAWSNFVKFG